MQGEEHITAAVEGEELIALEVGHHEVDARIFCAAQLQPVLFGALSLGREGFDHQGHLIGQGVVVDLAAKGGG